MPTLSNNPQLMRAVIMDHYENPRNKKTPANLENYDKIHMDSSSCVDDIWVYLRMENNLVAEMLWDGVACAISTASTSILSELVVGKTIEEAKHIINEYQKMIHEESYDDSLLGEAVVFLNTAKQPARIKCATLGWDGLLALLKEEENGR